MNINIDPCNWYLLSILVPCESRALKHLNIITVLTGVNKLQFCAGSS